MPYSQNTKTEHKRFSLFAVFEFLVNLLQYSFQPYPLIPIVLFSIKKTKIFAFDWDLLQSASIVRLRCLGKPSALEETCLRPTLMLTAGGNFSFKRARKHCLDFYSLRRFAKALIFNGTKSEDHCRLKRASARI